MKFPVLVVFARRRCMKFMLPNSERQSRLPKSSITFDSVSYRFRLNEVSLQTGNYAMQIVRPRGAVCRPSSFCRILKVQHRSPNSVPYQI